jgi:tRNA modification GTPase
MEPVLSDNIVAEMTPQGRAAVSGVRISGPEAKKIIEDIFSVKLDEPRFAYHVDHDIDDMVMTYYKAPNSYTGQDVCEIFCHGNPGIVDAILNSILTIKGFYVRMACPGEFTKRAYLNGKMDLMQAEAIVDIINSSTKKAAELRGRTLKGQLSEKLADMNKRLMDLAVRAELEIDFEEDKAGVFNYDAALKEITNLKEVTKRLISSFKNIEKLSGDIKVLITGAANVGKSSLFNKILEYERSIVHHLPGTTRDYIEAELMLGDFEVTFVDTAGLRDGYDSDIEAKGAEKIRGLIEDAFLIINVNSDDDHTLDSNKIILVRNKIDINKPSKKEKNVIYTCAYTGEGIEELKTEVEKRIKDHIKIADDRNDVFLFNKRQMSLVSKVDEALEALVVAVKKPENVDIVSLLIRNNIRLIDELIGKEHVPEEVLDELFSRFCIGK